MFLHVPWDWKKHFSDIWLAAGLYNRIFDFATSERLTRCESSRKSCGIRTTRSTRSLLQLIEMKPSRTLPNVPLCTTTISFFHSHVLSLQNRIAPTIIVTQRKTCSFKTNKTYRSLITISESRKARCCVLWAQSHNAMWKLNLGCYAREELSWSSQLRRWHKTS